MYVESSSGDGDFFLLERRRVRGELFKLLNFSLTQGCVQTRTDLTSQIGDVCVHLFDISSHNGDALFRLFKKRAGSRARVSVEAQLML